MIDREPSAGVLVDKRECGTGHFCIRSDSGNQPLHELRFTGAKLTDQSDDASSPQGAAELTRDSLRLDWTNGSERSHGEIFDPP